MKPTMPGLVALFVLLPLILWPANGRAAAKVGADHPPLTGTLLTAPAGAVLKANQAITSQRFAGKVLLVDFWATWCAPCKASLPVYSALQKKYGASGLQVLAVSVDDKAQTAKRFATKHGLSLAMLHDKGGELAERYGPAKMPTAFLIGRDGKVRWIHSGFEAKDAAIIEAKVAEALGPARWLRHERELMGTRFVVMAKVRGAAQEVSVKNALERVSTLEQRWSPWVPTSELSRVNQTPVGKPAAVSAQTAALMVRALKLCRLTRGAFDPTFFSLHDLWQLKKRPFDPPSKTIISKRLAAVGCDKLTVNAAKRQVTRRHSATRIHLGGNAKGTALDEAAAVLRRAGVTQFVVDGGGDMVTSGHGPKGPWRVGVRQPRGASQQISGRLLLGAGEAVATSGDYERFVLHAGKRYHHILDPRTGWPVQGVRQVTLVVPAGPHAGERADGLATAVFVLGPKAGLALIARISGVDALIIADDGRWHLSPGMAKRLGR
ncbi:MAG: FAD:protein FMN transferase [Myxococcales bacterium]|nr:FAD:protein FMN transferase [Myxococcales bacterium]